MGNEKANVKGHKKTECKRKRVPANGIDILPLPGRFKIDPALSQVCMVLWLGINTTGRCWSLSLGAQGLDLQLWYCLTTPCHYFSIAEPTENGPCFQRN